MEINIHFKSYFHNQIDCETLQFRVKIAIFRFLSGQVSHLAANTESDFICPQMSWMVS